MLRVIALLIAAIIAVASGSASARVPLGNVMVMAFSNSAEFVHGYPWATNTLSDTLGRAQVKAQIEDAYAMGVRAFLMDATSNQAVMVRRLTWWNAEARDFNAAHPSDPVCITPMYESSSAGNGTTDGAKPMFDAADAGSVDKPSPLCSDGSRAVIATWGNNTCVNPLSALSGRGPFTIVATAYNNGANILDASCVTALRSGGTNHVISYIWSSGNSAFSSEGTVLSKKTSVLATGADEFAMGIGSTRAEICGEGGAGAKTSDIRLTDQNFWEHMVEGFRIAIDNSIQRVMLTMAGPGDLGEGSYVSSALICDPRDKVDHSSNIGGISHGFTCPNVPDYLKAAMPTGFFKSMSVPLWTHRGMWRVAQVLGNWVRTGVEPGTDQPFVAFAYRQHKWGLNKTWQICNGGSYTIMPASKSGGFQGDDIALTSWSASPIRVRVKLAGDTLFDGTLPAKQARIDGSTQQTKIAIGNRLGRPIIEILNSNGDVIASKEGLLEITDTPKHFGGRTGRNVSLYADYIDIGSGTGGGGDGAVTAIEMTGQGGQAINNLVYGVAGSGIAAVGAVDAVRIAGNTVSGVTGAAINIGADAGSGHGSAMVVAGNIAASSKVGISSSGDLTAPVVSKNLVYGNTTAMSAPIDAVDSGTITTDPAFVGSGNYHLQSSSPARDAADVNYNTGVDRDGRARGSAPDIGAFEWFDPTARQACVETPEPPDPCDPGGADYPCQPVIDACRPPPTLTSPTNISVGKSGGSYSFGQNEDAMITCSTLVENKVTIIGGRNVHMRGCGIRLNASDTKFDPVGNKTGLQIVGVKNFYLEGSFIDANDRCDASSTFLYNIDPVTKKPTTPDWMTDGTDHMTITFVNVWLGNNNYNKLTTENGPNTCHGDCLQIQGEQEGGQVDINLNNVTCHSKAQGFFIPDRQVGYNNVTDVKRANTRYNNSNLPYWPRWTQGDVLWWFMGNAADNPNVIVNLDSVYHDWNKANRQMMPGGAGKAPTQYYDISKPDEISFPNTHITGVLKKGLPPSGDYAPQDKLGANYDRADFCTN